MIKDSMMKKENPETIIHLSGKLCNIRVIETFKGRLMAFAELHEKDKTFELAFFPESYNKYSELLKEGSDVEFQAKENKTERGITYAVL